MVQTNQYIVIQINQAMIQFKKSFTQKKSSLKNDLFNYKCYQSKILPFEVEQILINIIEQFQKNKFKYKPQAIRIVQNYNFNNKMGSQNCGCPKYQNEEKEEKEEILICSNEFKITKLRNLNVNIPNQNVDIGKVILEQPTKQNILYQQNKQTNDQLSNLNKLDKMQRDLEDLMLPSSLQKYSIIHKKNQGLIQNPQQQITTYNNQVDSFVQRIRQQTSSSRIFDQYNQENSQLDLQCEMPQDQNRFPKIDNILISKLKFQDLKSQLNIRDSQITQDCSGFMFKPTSSQWL